MAQTFSFEEAMEPTSSPFDAALQAEGVTGRVADIARSIYQQESGGGKNTKTSNAGAVGGMQIVPATFKGVADEGWDINDPVHNARAGIRYIQQMNKLAGGDPALTAAGYYGGPGGLKKARQGVAVSDPRNPNAPNTLEYGQQVAARIPKGAVAQVMDKVTDSILPSANAQEVPGGSKAAPVTFSFEDAQLPASAAPKRSMVDELGRQLGLTVRAGVKGVASIPAMVSDSITPMVNTGLDAVAGKGKGPRFQNAGQALERMLSAVGLPEPENSTERVVQDLGSSMAGAGSMAKGGLALAKHAAAPVTKGLGSMLAEGSSGISSSGLGKFVSNQSISAAAGAGASGVVRENGGGAGAQLAAGLIGGAAPSLAPYARDAGIRGIVRGGEKGRQRVAENLATFEAAGTTPTVGQAVGGNLQRIEAVLEKAPGSAGVMAKRAQQQIDDMSAAVQQLSDELAPGASAVNAGEAIAKSARLFKEGFKIHQNRLYNTLDKYIATDTPIEVGRTQEALKALNADIPGAPNISEFFKNARIKGIDRALQADLDAATAAAANGATSQIGVLPYEAIKKLRTLVGNEIADNSLVSDVPRSKWASLYGALSDDLGVAATKAGPKAEQSWQWANQYTKTQLERLEQVSNIVGKDAPEKVFAAAILGTAEGDTIAKRVISMIPKSQRREVAAAVLQRLGRATVGQQNADLDAFSSETFLTNLSKFSVPARKTIFGRTDIEGIEEQVGQFAKVAEARRAGGKIFSNPSGTASLGGQLVNAGAIGSGMTGAWLTGNPMPLVGALAMPLGANITAKRLISPESVKFLAGRTEMNPAFAPAMANATAQAHAQPAPAPGPQTFSFEDAQFADPASPDAEPPVRIELDGMAQPDIDEPVADPAQEPGAMDGIDGVEGEIPLEAPQGAAEIDPAHAFTSQARPDGTLAIAGDPQALRSMLAEAGIPARSLVPTKDGLLVGRTQAGRVQEAIDRMNAPAPDATAAAPADMPPETMAEAAPAQGQGMPQKLASSQPQVQDEYTQASLNPAVETQQEAAPAPIDVAAHDAATSPKNDRLEPTPGQQQAGNYKLGHDRIAGMDISIENPQGSVRRGVDPDGKPWQTQMAHHYGYLKKTTANDGDKLDVFVKPGTLRDFNGPVFVIDQVDPRTGKLDEHKTILGAKDEAEAKEIYRSNYAADWRGMGSITRLPLPVFKAWAASGDKKHPLGDLQGDQEEESPAQAAASTDQANPSGVLQSSEPLQVAQPQQGAPVERIQRLRDSGENKVADMLQRRQTLGTVQTELASMQAATPDLQHHASAAFSQHYQQRRLAGMKPAEASAHAGMLAAVQTAAPQIGMPDSAVKALTAKLQDVPIDEAPGFIERFTQALIKRGMVQPFEGSNQIASMAEQARDSAMNAALDGLYGDNPATTHA